MVNIKTHFHEFSEIGTSFKKKLLFFYDFLSSYPKGILNRDTWPNF